MLIEEGEEDEVDDSLVRSKLTNKDSGVGSAVDNPRTPSGKNKESYISVNSATKN